MRKIILVLLVLLLAPNAYAQCQQVLFSNISAGGAHLWVMGNDGSCIHELSGVPADAASESSWSHDGTMIAFASGGVIYRINADGTNLIQLSPAASSTSADYNPDWSPDNRAIVFSNDQIDLAHSHMWSYITSMNAMDGSGRTPIIGNGSNSFFYPHLSPADPSQLLFTSDLNTGAPQLFVYNIASKSLNEITHVDGAVDEPFWSPDGKHIIAQCAINGMNFNTINVCLMNADGSNIHEITSFLKPLDIGDPAWSPDGASIVFELTDCTGLSNCEGQTNPNAPAKIWTMSADGSNQRSTGQPCSAEGCAPRFRP